MTPPLGGGGGGGQGGNGSGTDAGATNDASQAKDGSPGGGKSCAPSAYSIAPGALYPAVGDSVEVVAGDVNGDGKDDLVATVSSSGIAIFLNKGDGTFGASKTYPPASGTNGLSGAALGDFNGDGALDVVANGSSIGDPPNYFLNAGDGTFGLRGTAITVNQTSQSGSSSLAVADFNGDKRLDVVIRQEGGDFSILLNTGSTTPFTGDVDYTSPGTTSNVAVGDYNGDGAPDLAFGNTQDNDVDIFLNDGHGGFPQAPTSKAAKVLSGPSWIAAADLNNDGKVDVAATDNQNGSFYVLVGKGDGTFAVPATYTTVATDEEIVAGDLNNDGFTDLVTLGDANVVGVHLNKGDGTFPTFAQGSAGGASAYAAASLTVGNYNGTRVLGPAFALPDLSNGQVAVFGGVCP